MTTLLAAFWFGGAVRQIFETAQMRRLFPYKDRSPAWAFVLMDIIWALFWFVIEPAVLSARVWNARHG